MPDKETKEYKTVIKLFEDGKITEDERDRLLAALDGNEDGYKYAADSRGEPAGAGMNRSLDEILSGLGKQLAASLRRGFRKASSAMEDAAAAIRRTAKKSDATVSSDSGKYDIIEKIVREKFDAPYADMKIEIRYIDKAGLHTVTERGADVKTAKSKCREVMTDEFYTAVAEKLDDKFCGSYKRVHEGVVLKMTILP